MDKIKAFFKNSETIFIARFKLFAGLAFTAFQQSGVDIASIVESPKLQVALKIFFAYLIVDGSVSEWARRRGATDL